MRTQRKASWRMRSFVWALVAATAAALSSPAETWAILIPAQGMQRQQDIQRVGAALENKIVSARLSQLGFTPEEINQRLSKLSNEEVHHLALHAEAINAAGDGGFDTVVALGAVAVLVLLLVYLIKRLNRGV
jgi:hypothetical protein